jgi:hypothetical protein
MLFWILKARLKVTPATAAALQILKKKSMRALLFTKSVYFLVRLPISTFLSNRGKVAESSSSSSIAAAAAARSYLKFVCLLSLSFLCQLVNWGKLP